jgi:hypothetical protein
MLASNGRNILNVEHERNWKGWPFIDYYSIPKPLTGESEENHENVRNSGLMTAVNKALVS